MTKDEIKAKIKALKKEKEKLLELAGVADTTQHSFKIFLNSIYGVLGSIYYPAYDIDSAEATTLSGQKTIKEMISYVNIYLNKLLISPIKSHIVAGDTDSLYIHMGSIIKKLFNKDSVDWRNKDDFHKIKDYCDNVFQEDINKHCADFVCENFHTDQRIIEFKREKLSAQGEFCAKKRYIVHVFDSEGLEKEKWSYTGVDIAKNELPGSIKKLLKQFIEGLIENDWHNDIIQQKLMEMYNEYISMPIKDVAFIKNLNTPKESTSFLTLEKGAGVHARSAEYYNQLLDEFHLTGKYDKIAKGDRFFYAYIKDSNKYGINAIGWKDRYPQEFDTYFEINKIKMFEKTILAPLRVILLTHRASTFDPTNIAIPSKAKCDIFDL